MKDVFKEKEMLMSAVLSTIYKIEQKDNIDLLVPFVKYSIGKNFSVGEKIDFKILSNYLMKNFSYKIFPEALVFKILNRILKKENVIIKHNKEYVYNVDISEIVKKFEENKATAEDLILDVSTALCKYLNDVEHENISLDKSKNLLFLFLDRYGIFAYKNSEEIESISYQAEHYNFLIGKFVIEERNQSSVIFNKLVDLVKGMILSKAVYLQTYNDHPINTKFQNVFVFSDTSLLMSILGLKSEAENSLAKEFNDSIPKNVKKVYFSHTLDELQSILRKYIYNKENKCRSSQTIEFFDENEYGIEDVKDYMIKIESYLSSLGFAEWEDTLSTEVKSEEVFDEEGLKKHLKENIPSYSSGSSDKMLENDIKSLYYIKRLRKGKTVNSIEKCKAVFVTSNHNLVKNVKEFLPDVGFHYIITHIDFIVLLWLKGNMKSDIPKQILVSNALAATENVGENFMKALIAKVDMLKKETKCMDPDSITLLVEDYYVRRELMEQTNCDADKLTVDTLNNVAETYKEKILKKANIDNKSLETENKKLSEEKLKLDRDVLLTNLALKEQAKNKARKTRKIFKISMLVIAWITILGLFVTGTFFTIQSILEGKNSIFAYVILILISIYGIIDMCCTSNLIIKKWINKISQSIYNKKYSKELEIFTKIKSKLEKKTD